MSKNTPGPWSYWSGYNPYDKIEAQVTAEGGDIVIASYNHLINEGEANAQLIAAAPDLLEALEYMLNCQYDYDPRRQADCDMCSKARAAIAKARGAE